MRGGLGALWLVFGCQSIAGVEDVSYSGASADDCAAYCDTLKEACPGDVAPYDDEATCLDVCATFKPGTSSSPQGNTLACRVDQANVALSLKANLSESQTNCAAAGPGGDKKCTAFSDTPNCEGYCTIYMRACDSKEWGFETLEQCVSRCAAFPSRGSYTAASGEAGDTLACRLDHATLALADPDNNCTAAGFLPAQPCVGSDDPDTDCEDYCGVNEVACVDEHEDYESHRQCLAVCGTFKKGDRATDTGGHDTVACRTYHSYFALRDPDTHCTHAGPTGDAVCSDHGDIHPNCEAFCNVFAHGCTCQFETSFGGDADACLDDCESLDDAAAGMQNSTGAAAAGDTLKCRTLHAVRALTEPLSPDAPDDCEAALGGAPCN